PRNPRVGSGIARVNMSSVADRSTIRLGNPSRRNPRSSSWMRRASASIHAWNHSDHGPRSESTGVLLGTPPAAGQAEPIGSLRTDRRHRRAAARAGRRPQAGDGRGRAPNIAWTHPDEVNKPLLEVLAD